MDQMPNAERRMPNFNPPFVVTISAFFILHSSFTPACLSPSPAKWKARTAGLGAINHLNVPSLTLVCRNMFRKLIPLILPAVLLAGCSSVKEKPGHAEASPAPASAVHSESAAGNPLRAFQKRAAEHRAVVSVPHFETATNEIQATVTNTIAAGNAALDRIGKLTASQVTFDNTVRALDDLGFQLGLVNNRLQLIQQMPPPTP
jgi:hypothetical protein